MGPPKYYDNKVLTEESAAVARKKCISLIRQHLSNHLKENPNTSYESWIASCHPENAKIALDPRFLITENNPWLEVWETVFYDKTNDEKRKNRLHQLIDDLFHLLGKVINSLAKPLLKLFVAAKRALEKRNRRKRQSLAARSPFFVRKMDNKIV